MMGNIVNLLPPLAAPLHPNPQPAEVCVYALGPIDDWDDWRLLFDGEHEAALTVAMDLAGLVGWEGDFVQGPFVPQDPGAVYVAECGVTLLASSILAAWKQSNNGQTFIAASQAVPALEAQHCAWAHGRMINPGSGGNPQGEIFSVHVVGHLRRIQVCR